MGLRSTRSKLIRFRAEAHSLVVSKDFLSWIRPWFCGGLCFKNSFGPVPAQSSCPPSLMIQGALRSSHAVENMVAGRVRLAKVLARCRKSGARILSAFSTGGSMSFQGQTQVWKAAEHCSHVQFGDVLTFEWILQCISNA